MVPSDDVLQAMQETNRRFCLEVVGQGNLDEINRVYTADAQILPPGAPLMKGARGYQGILAGGNYRARNHGAKFATLNIEISGNTAVEVGETE
jgi:hypothetical protein